MPYGDGVSQGRISFEPPEIWRPIHYLGSKLRLIGIIGKLVSGLPGGPICDLFAGSGTVAFALSKERDVVAADVQEYSRVICSALLRPSRLTEDEVSDLLRRIDANWQRLEACIEPLLQYEEEAVLQVNARPEMLCDLVENGSLFSGGSQGRLAAAREASLERLDREKFTASATRYFGGLYFSFRQSSYIDAVLMECRSDTQLGALLSTASAIVNSIGKQFAQPMRPRRKDGTIKGHLIRQMCRDRGLSAAREYATWLRRYNTIRQEREHKAICGDYRDVLRQYINEISVIYVDPPYTRDHYSRFYHVLETLCLRDQPEVSTSFPDGPTSRGVYRTDRHQSPFCIKSQAPSAFTDLFAGAAGKPMVMSYSPFVKDGHPRMMTIEAIATIAQSQYQKVEIVPASMVHSKLNRAELHLEVADQAEVFLVCR